MDVAHDSLQRHDASVEKPLAVVGLLRDGRRKRTLDADDVHRVGINRNGAVARDRRARHDDDGAAGEVRARDFRHNLDAALVRVVLRRDHEAVRLEAGDERDDTPHRHDAPRGGEFGRKRERLAGPEAFLADHRGDGGADAGKE